MQNSKENFFSIDRLIEFGIGMSMSQQIVQAMNNMMSQMRQPPLTQNIYQQSQQQVRQPVYQQYAQTQQASNNPAAFAQAGSHATHSSPTPIPQNQELQLAKSNISEVFYVSDKSKMSGPFSLLEIARLVVEKKVSAETLIWQSGDSEWKKAQDFKELLALIALVPPELPEEK
ncbi:DUF4339 domain-containing protein [Treponema sp.]|uniref:DUF4339 domain-containing protein n=1 Tax=Treponema sp. TaxID=166 RepID=UPI003F059360